MPNSGVDRRTFLASLAVATATAADPHRTITDARPAVDPLDLTRTRSEFLEAYDLMVGAFGAEHVAPPDPALLEAVARFAGVLRRWRGAKTARSWIRGVADLYAAHAPATALEASASVEVRR